MKDKILNWFVSGQVGLSSKAMACAAADLPQDIWPDNHPHDPDDFNRCLLLLQEVPEIRQHFYKISSLSGPWARLIERWDEVEAVFVNEVGLDWSKGSSAPETYALMKEILNNL